MASRFKRRLKTLEQRNIKDMDVEEILKELEKPHRLMKIRGPNSRFERKYFLDADHKAIGYEGSMKKNKRECRYNLSDVKDVREGFESEVFQKCKESDLFSQEGSAFSIIYGEKYFSLDLIAPSPEVRDMWVKGLRHLTLQMKSSVSIDDMQKIWVRDWFRRADLNHDGVLSWNEIENILKEMNAKFEGRVIRTFFKLVAIERKTRKRGKKALDEAGFEEFYHMIRFRKDLMEILLTIGDTKQVWDIPTLKRFLTVHQKMTGVTDETCTAIIAKHEIYEGFRDRNLLTVEGLRAYLLDPTNDLFNPAHTVIYQDMNQPLAHYFICSSHNTYLLEDQLLGRGSAEAYFHALDVGCRCLEADCHDGDDGEPIVFHQHTLVDKVLFEHVIRSVKQYAFKTSKYPLILSLEVSCSVEQQDRMAEILKNEFGDLIYAKHLNEDADDLPSPEQLKGKILIRGSKLRSNKTVKEVLAVEDEDKENKENSENQENKSDKEEKISRKLSELVTVFEKVKFVSFEHSRENYKCYQGSSLEETHAEALAKDEGADFVKHNAKFMTRIYPAGMRVASSNYDPIPLWNVGCQIVALNVQTTGEEMQMFHGKFLDNGGCGYVLKPCFLRDQSHLLTHHQNPDFFTASVKKLMAVSAPAEGGFDPENVNRKPLVMRLQIISGQQLLNTTTRDILDPFVRVHISGVSVDNDNQKTSVVGNNGFNPIWNQTLTFKIHVPELAVVHFRVRDSDPVSSNDTVAQYALPFTSMQQGYRHIFLRSKRGQLLPMSSLFVHCKIDKN